MNHRNVFFLLISLTFLACSTTKAQSKEKESVKKEVEEKKSLDTKIEKKELSKKATIAKKKDKKEIKVAKKKTTKQSGALKKGLFGFGRKTADNSPYRSLRDAEAIPHINANRLCKAMADRNTCPVDSTAKWSVGLRGDEVHDCMVQCEGKARRLDGPYERVSIYGTSNSFDRGEYAKSQPSGKWTRGRLECDPEKPEKACKEIVLSESHYRSGFGLHGEQKDWTPKGKLIRKQMYKNGTPVGDLREWWDNGKKRTVGKYKNGRLDGKYTQWHQGGKPSLTSTYRNGQLHGKYRRYDFKGSVLNSGTYLDGVKVGKWETFYQKNAPQSVENYDRKGKPNGKFCNWLRSGELLGCFMMKNGNGTFKQYAYGSKNVSHVYTMKDGQKDGKEQHYGYDGKLVSEVNWKQGQQHGMYTQWDHEGRVVSEFEYRHNEMHGKYYQRYWSSGKANITQGQYCRNRQCGTWEYALQDGRYRIEKYNANGTLISEKSYSASGELESQWPSENSNGSYQSCLQKMLSGGCCQRAANLPSGARICPPKYP